ncbi:DENN domain-containing protein 10-like [Branchiostoma lanceolatum]|uniref:DENN domain-containing protein 10-like n=1 Tax=Branchiostoma lanceolatum TaxID=7740 RepID=UPI003452BD84
MAALADLVAAALIERDTSGDVLWTWSYPSVSPQQRDLLTRKSQLTADPANIPSFVYGQWQRQWYYIKSAQVQEGDPLPKVTHFSLVIVSKDFNPEKYETFSRILCKAYSRTGSPAAMLQFYLAVVTRGSCQSEENGNFLVKEFDPRKAYAAGSVKDIVNRFGVESILIYTAILLKKKLVVYHPHLDGLLETVRAFPAFVWHRQNWTILYTNVDLVEEELEDLKSSGHYIAGFTDPMVESRTDLYDVFVNLSDGEISVAAHAKESMAMGKIHKDIAMAMVQCAEDDGMENQQVIKEIAKKTKELLNKVKSLATPAEEGGKPLITLDALRERKMAPANENFLFSLAAAEGLADL